MSKNGTELARYDSMCRAIAAAHKVDEVKHIRDTAIALAAYAKQAQNTDAERRAAEIRMRAERKAGQLLKVTKKNKGGNPNLSRRSTRCEQPKPLSELGITRDQSSQWQKLADMTDEQFSLAIGESTSPPTTGGLLRSSIEKRILRNSAGEPVHPDSLLLWGHLRDLEPLLDRAPNDLVNNMTDTMQDRVHRLAPKIAEWLKRIGATT